MIYTNWFTFIIDTDRLIELRARLEGQMTSLAQSDNSIGGIRGLKGIVQNVVLTRPDSVGQLDSVDPHDF